MNTPKTKAWSDTRKCIHLAKVGTKHLGFVNPPLYRGSTYLYPTLSEYQQAKQDRYHPSTVAYGRYGTQTSNEFEQTIASLEGGYGAMTVSSGLAAISTALSSFLSAGDHLLMVDSVFGPARRFCDNELSRCGIEVSYYSPEMGTDIETLIQANTKVIFMESPGSFTFEVQDIPAIVNVAKQHNIVTILDNTWSTPLLFKAMDHGVNVSLHAATKYISGHSDLVLGVIVTDQAHWLPVRKYYINVGQAPASDEVSLALRGLRTLPLRLKTQGETAYTVAKWLEKHPCVERVLHPALPSCVGHKFWKRDFNGSAGLFAIELVYPRDVDISVMVDELKLFGIGASWGGLESLILPHDSSTSRTTGNWQHRGILLRLSIGLESAEELIIDLHQGFNRLLNLIGNIYS